MRGSVRNILSVLLFTAAFAGTAAAEKTLTVNDNNTGVFDQPAVVMYGSVAHVAYIGDGSASGLFRVYHAAVNAGSDYTNLALARDNQSILSFPLGIDNAGTGGNSAYYDARHPKIVIRSSTEAVILFQAKPGPASVAYRPYIARLALSNNVASLLSVKEVTGFPTSAPDLATTDVEDISAGIVTTDNTVRIAFCVKSAIGAAEPFRVYFARVGIDNATVVGTPLLLSAISGSEGFRPIPSLRLDSQNRAHVAWVSNDNTVTANPVYYAMLKETNSVDNVVIAATQVISATMRWGHPQVQVSNDSSILLLAVDESVAGIAGNIGLVNINPDGDNQDGTPVQIGTNTSFFLTPPGELILPDEFNLYRPEAFLDSLGKIHMTGYGTGGSSCVYYAFRLVTSYPYHEITTARAQVGFDAQEFPGEIAGDYTRAAFGHFTSGKALVFWSGLVGGANRNLDVTAVPTSTAFSSDESGCSMVSDPRAGERDRIPGIAVLFLPALILAGRRVLIRRLTGRMRAIGK
jgi:hypothetical protein